MEQCLICTRNADIQSQSNPYFVAELETGYVVMGDFQFFRGYTLLLCKQHVAELHELEPMFRLKFLEEMSITAQAVFEAFRPVKLNYELLGNSERHLHWHLFPRHADDPLPNQPVWLVDKSTRYGESARPSPADLDELKSTILEGLQQIAPNQIVRHYRSATSDD